MFDMKTFTGTEKKFNTLCEVVVGQTYDHVPKNLITMQGEWIHLFLSPLSVGGLL